jgi:hypothetical protein
MMFKRNNGFAILLQIFGTYIMLSIKYRIQQRQFIVFRKMLKDMITSDAITSIRGIRTGMGEI